MPLQVPVALTSFTGKHMHLLLRKHPDRLHEDVLEAGGAEGAGERRQGRLVRPPARARLDFNWLLSSEPARLVHTNWQW